MALENKLGITNSAELAREEERISKRKAVELFESGALDKLAPGRFTSLQAIHKALFEDIYDFAGGKKVASLSWDKVKEIAEGKMSDLNAFEIEKAMSMVAGTARSMGITIDGEKPF